MWITPHSFLIESSSGFNPLALFNIALQAKLTMCGKQLLKN